MTSRMPPSQRPPHTLSVCMIVKNEEKNVGECLESVKSFADQAVVVDTGSSDRTVAIARKSGAVVVRSDWRNDFSYSRNISIDHAASQWVLWLDADDRVPPSEAEKFRKLKTAPPDRAFYLKVRNVRPGGFGEEWFQLRMFPNHPEIRFERKVHEQAGFAVQRLGMPALRVDVRIHHTGYEDPGMRRRKAVRNREILLAEFHRYREDPAFVGSIGDSYFLTEDFETAIQWYRRVLEIPGGEAKQPDIFRQMATSIALSYQRLKGWGNARRWIEKAIEASPEKIDSLFLAAELREKAGDSEAAAALYERITELPAACTSYAADSEGLKARALIALGRLRRKGKKFEEAERAFRICMEKYPQVLNSYSELGGLFLDEGKAGEAAQAFIGSIRKYPAGDPRAYFGLARALALMGRAEEAAKVLGEARALYPSYGEGS